MGLSILTQGWRKLDDTWDDPQIAQIMGMLLDVRSMVMHLLEQARTQKFIRSALEADVDILLPDGNDSDLCRAIKTHESLLAKLLIVSEVTVASRKSDDVVKSSWSLSDAIVVDGGKVITLRAQAAKQSKCPRCWKYTKPAPVVLCDRCAKAVQAMPVAS